ncbi:MAG: aminotransferase class I/II-fold pyridoxal phosphate-dependent enzyme [Alphaproteobacteria bacterium]
MAQDLFKTALSSLKECSRYRALSLPSGVDLTSNDYLGMAVHPVLRKDAIQALDGGMDIGAAGSRLLRGHTDSHAQLEEFAAAHFNAGKTLYFSSGFQANYALLTTLPQRGDIVLYDALVHASMREGLSAANAKSFKFAHNDLQALEDALKKHGQNAKTLWIAIESVYSMDGDIAPLNEIYALVQAYDAHIIIDEAHGTGVFGEGGRGYAWDLIKAHGYAQITTLHTCGKAVGVAGGLVCGSSDVIDYLINKARPFIYSTAPMPLQAFLVEKSLAILASEEGDIRRAKLRSLCDKACDLFGGSGTQVVPIILGSDEKALGVARALQDRGYDIRAIRPPTVPEGTSRLRLSLSSELSQDILQGFADALKEIT